MAYDTLNDVVREKYNSDAAVGMVFGDFLKESKLLQTMMFTPATHGSYDITEEVTTLPTGYWADFNDAYTVTNDATKEVRTNLGMMKMMLEGKEDTVEKYPGGVAGYFEKKKRPAMVAQGNMFAKQFFYGNDATLGNANGHKGLMQYASQFSNAVKIYSSGSSATTSIFFVRWDEENCTGLYNDAMFKMANVGGQTEVGYFDMEILNGGLPITDPVVNASGVRTGSVNLIYQARVKGDLGFKVLSGNNVYRLYNIKDATNYKPTVASIEKGIAAIKGYSNPGRCAIYMNSLAYRLVGELKNTKLMVSPSENNYSTIVNSWNGIPIYLDENIVSTEDNS